MTEKTFETERILYRDDACIVVNKLPGEALETRSDKKGTNYVFLPDLLCENLGLNKVYVSHRLDVPVSGAVLLATDSKSLAFFNRVFAGGKGEGRPQKLYWAIVEKNRALENLLGVQTSAELCHWLSVDGRHNKSYAHSEPGPNRFESRLRWRFMGMGERYAFIEIDLLTGRHHQIRAQLAALGLAIKGDLKYGARRSEREGGIRLHSHFLSFPQPTDGEQLLRVLAEPPRMDNLWFACSEAAKSSQIEALGQK